MLKLTSVLALGAITALTVTAYGSDLPVRLNGMEISQAVIRDDRALAPFRAVFENLGYDVDWDDGKITAFDVEKKLELNVGSNSVAVSDDAGSYTVDCGTPVIIIDDRAYVPVRAVAEISGCDVDWDGQAVDIYPE